MAAPRNEKTGTPRKYANEFAKSREARIAICAGTRGDELFDLREEKEDLYNENKTRTIS